jgi:NAD(P)-dependent dehydrogenase (short-subunit alcohol dehydrogenase family)
MTRWTAADMPALTGHTVMITGASSGIGLSAARELGRAGARVVLAVRNPVKGRQAAREIPGSSEVVELDVADLGSIRALAGSWSESISVLVNNAGVMQLPLTRSPDGFEMQAATNFLGPFALTNLLLPHVTGRVVTLSSQLHRRGHLRPDDLNWQQRRYNPTAAYCDSKLCATMFALELGRRLTAAGSPVRSGLAHPGIATTNLVAHIGGFQGMVNRLMRFMVNDADTGALSTLYAATQDIPGGSYVGPDGLGAIKGYPKAGRASAKAADPEAASRLWAAAAELTGTGASLALAS